MTYLTIIILAVADPKIRLSQHFNNTDSVLIIIDNSWASGPAWDLRITAAKKIVAQAKLRNKAIFLATTATKANGFGSFIGQASPSKALSFLDQLVPRPWAKDLTFLLKDDIKKQLPKSFETHWISDNLSHVKKNDVITFLQRYGIVSILSDNSINPKIISAVAHRQGKFQVTVGRSITKETSIIELLALDNRQRVIASFGGIIQKGERTKSFELTLPAEKKKQIKRFIIRNEENAAAVFLVDKNSSWQEVGLAYKAAYQSAHPLMDEFFYLENSVPKANYVWKLPINELIDRGVGLILLADAYKISFEEQNNLRQWILDGGTLVRFSGSNLAANFSKQESLLPVKLRPIERTLGGPLSWQRPLIISNFKENSPLANVPIYKDVFVERQLLAVPTPTLSEQTWAALVDGTPIVTAKAKGRGQVILLHTTATPEWGDLAISGQFVEIMKRIVSSEFKITPRDTFHNVASLALLNGKGRLATLKSGKPFFLNSKKGIKLIPGPNHPPGLYGDKNFPSALNLSLTPDDLMPEGSLPRGVKRTNFNLDGIIDFRTALLLIALVLFILDAIIILILRRLYPTSLKRFSVKKFLLCAVLLMSFSLNIFPANVKADEKTAPSDAFALMSSKQNRLAFVKSKQPEIDYLSLSALSTLTTALQKRTAVELGPPIGLDIDKDNLAFFSIIFCPLTALNMPINQRIQKKLNTYIENGGLLFIDSQDNFEATSSIYRDPFTARLKTLGLYLNITPLIPITNQHTLFKSFYLLKSFPGRFSRKTLWMRSRNPNNLNELTPIIAGSNDWFRAWAKNSKGEFIFKLKPNYKSQRELSIRFGINLVIYAMTGNYKADQLHTNNILKRLAQ